MQLYCNRPVKYMTYTHRPSRDYRNLYFTGRIRFIGRDPDADRYLPWSASPWANGVASRCRRRALRVHQSTSLAKLNTILRAPVVIIA